MTEAEGSSAGDGPRATLGRGSPCGVTAVEFPALRPRFPTLVERSYFATHCLGPVIDTALADLDEYRRTIPLRNRAIDTYLARIDEIRGLFARLVNADADEIALAGNATACHAGIAAALAPAPGRARIVTTRLDFPSTRYLWQAQAARGFELIEVASPDGIAMPVEGLVAAIDERVAIVAVSLVAYGNGALLRVRPVIEAARAAGALVVLDAYQAAGIVPIDVRALDVDAVVAGTHKWLHGASTGLAFAYVRRALAERLAPAYPGWFGHARMLDYEAAFVPAPGARRFEQGSPSVEAVYAARAGVRFALDVGVAAIRARSLALSDALIAGADGLGIALGMPRAHAERAGVVCLDVRDPGRAASELRTLGIDVDTRPGTGLRLSCHPCNLHDDIDRVLAELRRHA